MGTRGGSNEYPQSTFWSKNKKNMYVHVYIVFLVSLLDPLGLNWRFIFLQIFVFVVWFTMYLQLPGNIIIVL